jgi:hypothetical protein
VPREIVEDKINGAFTRWKTLPFGDTEKQMFKRESENILTRIEKMWYNNNGSNGVWRLITEYELFLVELLGRLILTVYQQEWEEAIQNLTGGDIE